MSITRHDYARAVKTQLGIPNTWAHVGCTRAMIAWMGAESGWYAPCDGVHGAKSNPFNTTLFVDGCTGPVPYNTDPGVQNYLSITCGIKATALTLQEDRYAALLATLRKSFVKASTIMDAIKASPWGTAGDLQAILATYQADRSLFNNQVITG